MLFCAALFICYLNYIGEMFIQVRYFDVYFVVLSEFNLLWFYIFNK